MIRKILLVLVVFSSALFIGCGDSSTASAAAGEKTSKVQLISLEGWASHVMVDTTLGVTCFKKVYSQDMTNGYFDCIPTPAAERKVTDELVSLFNWSDKILLDDELNLLCFEKLDWQRGVFACVPQDKVKPEGLAELRGMLKPAATAPLPTSDTE